ncbi:hypothetical protein ACHAW6_007123, partial [Cyclotella cf. meneghiniana]
DDGITSTIKLPGSLYVPGLPCPLLVPRHWSEQARDDKPLPDGTCAFFGNKSCKLYWDQRKHCKTIPYNDASKTPTFFTAPGSTIYHAFNAVFEANDASVPYQHLKDAVPPKCAGCLFGAMTKVPWHTKGQQNQGTVFVATYPGQCTSFDPLPNSRENLPPSDTNMATSLSIFSHGYTGLVSLQFHCRYDDFFETISFNKPETMMSSNWQILAGLVRPDKPPMVK